MRIVDANRERLVVEPLPLSIDTLRAALVLARDHTMSFYDALIVAAALPTGCDTLFSEDMQDGRVLGSLTIRNPFSNLGAGEA